MKEENIPYATVYPCSEPDMLNLYIGSLYRKGTPVSVIDKMIDTWSIDLYNVKEEPHGELLLTLKFGEYLDLDKVLFIRKFVKI